MINILAAIIAGGAGGRPPIYVVGRTYSAASLSPASCSVTFTVQTDGDLSVTYVGSGSVVPSAGEWWRSNPVVGLGTGWEVYVETVASTGTPSGTLDTWVSLSSSLTLVLTGTPSAPYYTFKLKFRPAGGSDAIYTSANITITAERAI